MAKRPALHFVIRVEVEVRAPATTPHAVVPFGEIRERVPRLHAQGFDPVAVHRRGAHPQTVSGHSGGSTTGSTGRPAYFRSNGRAAGRERRNRRIRCALRCVVVPDAAALSPSAHICRAAGGTRDSAAGCAAPGLQDGWTLEGMVAAWSTCGGQGSARTWQVGRQVVPEGARGLVLELTSVLVARRERIFAALITPVELAAWWGPEGFTTPEIDLELRPGGRYRFTMRPPEGDAF